MFFMLTYSNSKISADQEESYMELIIRLPYSKICPECKLQKQPRSKHCFICRTCVERFDHHCDWLGICVGLRNYMMYLVFISTIYLSIVLTFVLAVEVLIFEIGSDQYTIFWDKSQQIYILPYWFYTNAGSIFLLGMFLILQSIFLLPMTALVMVHIGNIWHGKTTSERFGH